MSIVYIDRVGYVEPANVSKVWRVPGHWYKGGRRWVQRKYIFWGKPYRERDWCWYCPSTVYVRYVGTNDPQEIECQTAGEMERVFKTIISQLNAAKNAGPERVVAAAVMRYEENRSLAVHDEKVYVQMTYTMPAPARHPNILHSMPEDPTPLGGVHDCIQGFITSTGRFVGRKEAMGIAVASGQVAPSKVTAPDLFSEDVW